MRHAGAGREFRQCHRRGVLCELQVRIGQYLIEGQTDLTLRAASMVRTAGQQPAVDPMRRAQLQGCLR